MSEPILEARDLYKTFDQGSERIEVLTGASCVIEKGERVAILGRSGSGKSTLLHILAGLDDPDAGDVTIAGKSLTKALVGERAAIRNRYMGFVYQLHHLLPEFSAAENVAMSLRLGGTAPNEAMDTAVETLALVGLAERTTHRPGALSGGERQRVAVARALVGAPRVILADEPTGNLDKDNARQVFELMCRLSDETGVAFVMVTHDEAMVDSMHRVLRLDGGTLTVLS
ncbi:MAG: ABC transporter ATP-binding protein [Pseudomonadales bacterium]